MACEKDTRFGEDALIEEYTIEEIDEAIAYTDATVPDDHSYLIMDALLFYKEMHYPNGI